MLPLMAIRVALLSQNVGLADVITRALAGDDDLCTVPFAAVQPLDVIVATPDACTPCRCAELVRRSLRVILLCALPNKREEAAYREAGAVACVPMTGGLSTLREVLLLASNDQSPPARSPGWC